MKWVHWEAGHWSHLEHRSQDCTLTEPRMNPVSGTLSGPQPLHPSLEGRGTHSQACTQRHRARPEGSVSAGRRPGSQCQPLRFLPACNLGLSNLASCVSASPPVTRGEQQHLLARVVVRLRSSDTQSTEKSANMDALKYQLEDESGNF